MTDSLINNKKVYYVYDLGAGPFEIEGLPEDYVVVVDDSFKARPVDGVTFFTMSEWFSKVINCEILPWMCACLNKKFVVKEHLKLLMTTDPLQLRKNINKQLKALKDNPSKRGYWELARNLVFTNQIIENHKIVNFKNLKHYYKIIEETDLEALVDNFEDIMATDLAILHSTTDGLIKADIIKRANLKNESK